MDDLAKDLTADIDSYARVRRMVKKGDYQEAVVELDKSGISDSTKRQLKLALESGERYVVEKVFGEMDARIMQALCWDCWRLP